MKEMRSWTPRPPSKRIEQELFGSSEVTPKRPQRMEMWRWLTPAAACGLTMLLAVGGMNRPAESLDNKDDATLYASVVMNPASSNAEQMVRLSQRDENVEWNVWPVLSSPGPWTSLAEVRNAPTTNLTR